MLPEFAKSAAAPLPRITKSNDGIDAGSLGAFPSCAVLRFDAILPRELASAGVVLRIARDTQAPGEENADGSDRDFAFDFVSTDFVNDKYRLELDLSQLCDGGCGLLYYEYLFPRGMDTLFSDTYDNVNFTLAGQSSRRFRMLLYDVSFSAPDVGDGIMYHVFVDRFAKGEGKVKYRDDAVLHKSWDSEMPEYAAVRGGFVANNDFFGGNLWGVAEKLPYLETLGVNIVYLSPVFDSPSNHKYDTSDYTEIDKGFGGREAFEHLLVEAKKRGMRVVLDGVFNHTGADSRYFDRNAKYGLPASDENAKYHGWYNFSPAYKNGYEAWWDIDILPRLRTDRDDVREFFAGKDGVCAAYSSLGCGWRLDVADELPDAFLEELRSSVKAKDPDALIIGEVWENAADKIAYGRRRSYFRGRQLDSVMNYPLRRALLDFGAFGDAAKLSATLNELWSSYPQSVSNCLMNIIGTHDTYRALSFLGRPGSVRMLDGESDNSVLAAQKLTQDEYKLGIARLRAVSVLQYTVFGFPCVYYGDETAMEGLGDPFCRMPMKWGKAADAALLEHYRRLGRLRHGNHAFAGGSFSIKRAVRGLIVFERSIKGPDASRVTVAVNCGSRTENVVLRGKDLYSGRILDGKTSLEPYDFVIVKE